MMEKRPRAGASPARRSEQEALFHPVELQTPRRAADARSSRGIARGDGNRRLNAAEEGLGATDGPMVRESRARADRKSTRLNSSHVENSYAVFCLKKKRKKEIREAVD